MNLPSTALLRAFSPFWRNSLRQSVAPSCLLQQQLATFTSTPQRQKRNKGGHKVDMRITQIRYHLQHPLTPRPLRFSRTRALRHWTIHRAWRSHVASQRRRRERELERQYNSMSQACEALRLIDDCGMTPDDRARIGEPADGGREVGRLYKIAMLKKGVWDGVPIEYARIQTDSPPRAGWNGAWTR